MTDSIPTSAQHSSQPSERDERIRQSLDALVETLVPRIEQEELLEHLPPTSNPLRSGSEPNLKSLAAFTGSERQITEHLLRKLERSPDRIRLEQLLLRMHHKVWNGLLFGVWLPISEMNANQKLAMAQAWSRTRLKQLRSAWWGLKRAILFTAYSKPDSTGNHPLWEAIDYRSPHDAAPAIESTQPRISQSLSSWTSSQANANADAFDCDVLIVGSGASGGVAAESLARNGKRVIVIEHGAEVPRSQLGQSEWEGNRRLFDKQGALTTTDQSITLLAGHGLGGGTTVNWMTSLATPIEIRREWKTLFSVDLLCDAWEQSREAVEKRLSVSTNPAHVNLQNEVLQRGCERLGLSWRNLPRNGSCDQCDRCGFGCRYGLKQDVRNTFLSDAHRQGAVILSEARVDRILHSGNRVIGVEVRPRGASINSPSITLRARQVVLAAGAIHTPSLLLRSQLGNFHVGRHLTLHPTTAIASFFPEPIRAWQGAPQTILCDQWSFLNGSPYGVRLEVAPVHPGFAAMALSWSSGAQHKSWLAQLERLASLIVLTRDVGSGRVKLRDDGLRVSYRMQRRDWQHLSQGVGGALQIHRAAGATWTAAPFHAPNVSECNSSRWDEYVKSVERQVVLGRDVALYSAHQMSSCRMTAKSSSGVVDRMGRVWGVENLTLVDGSVLPSACGVNPMLTIMTMARMLSERLLDRM